MATSAALTDCRIFPSGTSVGAYPRATAFPPHGLPVTGVAPVGAATASATATGSGVSITGLSAATEYVLSASVGGVQRHVSCVLDA